MLGEIQKIADKSSWDIVKFVNDKHDVRFIMMVFKEFLSLSRDR